MYIVIEIQKAAGGQVSTIVNSYESYSTAEQKYHQILSYAAVSELPSHAAAILLPDGTVYKHQCYEHGEV